MNSKEIFIAKKELRDWWSNICDDQRLVEVILHAKAVAFEGCPTEQERHGVLVFAEILFMLSTPDDGPTDFKQPGLTHNLEPVRPANQKKKK